VLEDVDAEYPVKKIRRVGKLLLAIPGDRHNVRESPTNLGSNPVAKLDAMILRSLKRLDLQVSSDPSANLQGAPPIGPRQVTKSVSVIELLDYSELLRQYFVPILHEIIGHQSLSGRQIRNAFRPTIAL
jgi:hypothetical protein